MKKLIMFLLIVAANSQGADFSMYWPWIESNINKINNSPGMQVTAAEVNQWQGSSFRSIWQTTLDGQLELLPIAMQPQTVLWRVNESGQAMPQLTETDIGFFRVNIKGEIVLASIPHPDIWWTTNTMGQLIVRNSQ